MIRDLLLIPGLLLQIAQDNTGWQATYAYRGKTLKRDCFDAPSEAFAWCEWQWIQHGAVQ